MKKAARKISSAIALSLFFFGVFATAQQPKAAGRVILHGGKLLDVRSGKTLTDQAIVIDGGKIVSVGPFAQATHSPGDRLIDLGNATVLPGLTDAHTHMTGDPQDVGYEGLGISIPRALPRCDRLSCEARLPGSKNATSRKARN